MLNMYAISTRVFYVLNINIQDIARYICYSFAGYF